MTCIDGYSPGNDTVIFTTPYTYAQVMSIIGSFRNITWSGSPYDTVSLNGVSSPPTYNRGSFLELVKAIEALPNSLPPSFHISDPSEKPSLTPCYL
jgi:hypothetical protein